MLETNKDIERHHLHNFLNARKSACGEELSYVRDSESPDFICRRPDGTEVGVEHTRVAYSSKVADEISEDEWNDSVDDYEVFWSAYNSCIRKEAKRRKPHWKTPDSTILVLDFVYGCALQYWKDSENLSGDFSDSGFLEVWLMDHSSIETHGVATAIGLFPEHLWGIRGQGYLGAPPYK